METKKRKQSLRLQLSFRETTLDLEKYNFLINEIKDLMGVSTYIKRLIENDELYQNYQKKIALQSK